MSKALELEFPAITECHGCGYYDRRGRVPQVQSPRAFLQLRSSQIAPPGLGEVIMNTLSCRLIHFNRNERFEAEVQHSSGSSLSMPIPEGSSGAGQYRIDEAEHTEGLQQASAIFIGCSFSHSQYQLKL